MKIAIGSDHAGFELKEYIKGVLPAGEYDVTDVGTHSPASVDYPDFGLEAARRVAAGEADRDGLVNRIGMSIVANKVNEASVPLSLAISTLLPRAAGTMTPTCSPRGQGHTGKGLAEEIARRGFPLSSKVQTLWQVEENRGFRKNTDR